MDKRFLLETFEELETLQVSHGTDLTGTFITSNEHVAVFSGNKCIKFVWYKGFNHILSQLPPFDLFDN